MGWWILSLTHTTLIPLVVGTEPIIDEPEKIVPIGALCGNFVFFYVWSDDDVMWMSADHREELFRSIKPYVMWLPCHFLILLQLDRLNHTPDELAIDSIGGRRLMQVSAVAMPACPRDTRGFRRENMWITMINCSVHFFALFFPIIFFFVRVSIYSCVSSSENMLCVLAKHRRTASHRVNI